MSRLGFEDLYATRWTIKYHEFWIGNGQSAAFRPRGASPGKPHHLEKG